jgi:hypothetical protein
LRLSVDGWQTKTKPTDLVVFCSDETRDGGLRLRLRTKTECCRAALRHPQLSPVASVNACAGRVISPGFNLAIMCRPKFSFICCRLCEHSNKSNSHVLFLRAYRRRRRRLSLMSCRSTRLGFVKHLLTLLSFVTALSDGHEHCQGYVDSNGMWNNGFYCPRWGGPDDKYCCGDGRDGRERYCCPEPTASSGTRSAGAATPAALGRSSGPNGGDAASVN